MRPRTKRQVLVCDLSERLHNIAMKLEPWAFENCIEHIGFRNKMWTSCLTCGYVWPTTSMTIKTEVCPDCGWKLKLETTRKQKSRDWARFAVLNTIEDFQVVRYFDINCHMRASRKPSMYTREIMQHWILPNGEFEIISCQVGGMGLSYDHFGGAMSLKDKKDIWKYNIPVLKIHPEMYVQPIYKRNGFTSSLTDFRPFDLFRNLPTDSITETLLKTKQFSLLRARLGDRSSAVYRHWDSIKICIRNKYIVKDAINWLDYIDLLLHFNKDIRNAVYVCPKNFHSAHDKLVKRKRDEENRRSIERKKKQWEEDQAEYKEAKERYFGLCFSKGNLTVKVLETIQEFIEEGDAHKHCVYTNAYYRKNDSLIFSAKVDGRPVETVQVSLTEMRVVQSRGLQNQMTKYHQEIIDLINSNMHQIEKRSGKLQTVAA